MRVSVAPNIHAGSLADAARLVVPAYRLIAPGNRKKLSRAESHQQRDELLRSWSRRINHKDPLVFIESIPVRDGKGRCCIKE